MKLKPEIVAKCEMQGLDPSYVEVALTLDSTQHSRLGAIMADWITAIDKAQAVSEQENDNFLSYLMAVAYVKSCLHLLNHEIYAIAINSGFSIDAEHFCGIFIDKSDPIIYILRFTKPFNVQTSEKFSTMIQAMKSMGIDVSSGVDEFGNLSPDFHTEGSC